jgi:hypothetical protein
MTDPAFNDAGNGDFSRPSASAEMNRTYGGRDWTLYGAEQPSDTSSGKFIRNMRKSFYIDDKNKPHFYWCDVNDWMFK